MTSGGLKWDGTMAAVLAETGVASCLMHNRKDTDYKDYLNDVVADLDETMKMAKEAGIKKEKRSCWIQRNWICQGS